MTANKTQIGGTHYTDMAVQPWDFMQSCMSAEQFAGYLLGNVIKYAARHQAKGGIEDLHKARHYLDKLIETKEVMQFAGHAPVAQSATTPAVSESAAGASAVAAAYRDSVRCGVGLFKVNADGSATHIPETDVTILEWPGPDWSQAPEWAMWWAKDLSNNRGGCWFEKKPQMNEEQEHRSGTILFGGYWSLGKFGSQYKWSSDQGYTGHWRDSLRKRPSKVVVHEETLGAVLS